MPRKLLSIGAAALCTALLSSPVLAQSRGDRVAIRWTGPAVPECVYKGVMTNADIEACTGRKVQYDYRVIREEKVAVPR